MNEPDIKWLTSFPNLPFGCNIDGSNDKTPKRTFLWLYVSRDFFFPFFFTGSAQLWCSSALRFLAVPLVSRKWSVSLISPDWPFLMTFI